MIAVKDLRSFLFEWNNTFVLDKLYRSKNNIRFNSLEHRNTCQIDIYLEYLEDEIFSEHTKQIIDKERMDSEYKKGIWLQDRLVDNTELTKLFDNLDIENIED